MVNVDCSVGLAHVPLVLRPKAESLGEFPTAAAEGVLSKETSSGDSEVLDDPAVSDESEVSDDSEVSDNSDGGISLDEQVVEMTILGMISTHDWSRLHYFVRGWGEQLRSSLGIPPRPMTRQDDLLLRYFQKFRSGEMSIVSRTIFVGMALVYIGEVQRPEPWWTNERCYGTILRRASICYPHDAEAFKCLLRNAPAEIAEKLYETILGWGEREMRFQDTFERSCRISQFEYLIKRVWPECNPWSEAKRGPSIDDLDAYLKDIWKFPITAYEQEVARLVMGGSVGEDEGEQLPKLSELGEYLGLDEVRHCGPLLSRAPSRTGMLVCAEVLKWADRKMSYLERKGFQVASPMPTLRNWDYQKGAEAYM